MKGLVAPRWGRARSPLVPAGSGPGGVIRECCWFGLSRAENALLLPCDVVLIRMEVALHADSPYIARDKKSFRMYSTVQHSLSLSL